MKCLDDCHTYELNYFGQGVAHYDRPGQIHFYEMREDGTKVDGVTNEEVIRVLIHRLTFLNEKWMDGKFRCQENTLAIMKLHEALMWLKKRTADRQDRGVEGTREA